MPRHFTSVIDQPLYIESLSSGKKLWLTPYLNVDIETLSSQLHLPPKVRFWFSCYKSMLSQDRERYKKRIFVGYESVRLINSLKRGKWRLSKWKIEPICNFNVFNLANPILCISVCTAKLFLNANVFLENQ